MHMIADGWRLQVWTGLRTSDPAELSGGGERGIRVMSETYAQARHRIAMTPIPLEVVRRRLLNRGRHRMTWAEYAERGRSSIRGKQNNAISNRADWVRGRSGCFPLWLGGDVP